MNTSTLHPVKYNSRNIPPLILASHRMVVFGFYDLRIFVLKNRKSLKIQCLILPPVCRFLILGANFVPHLKLREPRTPTAALS
jgi:hypothetical protein